MEQTKDILKVFIWVIYVVKVLKFVLICIKLYFKFTVENNCWALETANASSAFKTFTLHIL